MNGRYTFYKTLIIALTLGALFLLWRLAEVIIVLLGAIIFASAIRPLVERITRPRIPKGVAILLVYFLIFGTIGGLFAIAIPPLVDVIQNLLQDEGLIVRIAVAVYGWIAQLGYAEIGADVFGRIVEEWELLQSRVGIIAAEQGPSTIRSIAEGLAQFILGLVMAFYWLTARDQIQGLMLAVTPIRTRGLVETVFNAVENTLGAWVRATGILMLSIGLAAFVGLLLLGIPGPLPLALLAGLFEGVPVVGPMIGAAPAVLIAFAISPAKGLLTILLFVVIQFLENNVLVPRVMEHNVGLNPLVVVTAIVAGGLLNGAVGAVLAIPVAAALQVIFRYLLLEPMIEEAKETHLESGVPVFDVEGEKGAPPPSEIIIPGVSTPR